MVYWPSRTVSDMVAKPDVHSPATAPDEEPLEHDPLSLPIRLEFGPALAALAEAGYVGERLNEWLIQFNRANKDTIGKLELDAEGRLLITPMQSLLGSEPWKGNIVLAELYIWAREYGGQGPRLAAGRRTAQRRPLRCRRGLAVPGATGGLRIFGRGPGWVRFCPHFVAEVMSRNDRPSAARRKMEEYIANGARLGLAHRPLPAAGPRLPPRRRPRHAGRPGAVDRRPRTARLRLQRPRPDFRRSIRDNDIVVV